MSGTSGGIYDFIFPSDYMVEIMKNKDWLKKTSVSYLINEEIRVENIGQIIAVYDKIWASIKEFGW